MVGYAGSAAGTRPRSFVPMPQAPEARTDPETQIQRALDAARTLSPSAEPVLNASEIANLTDNDPVSSLGLMAYVARLERCRPSRATTTETAREPVKSTVAGRKFSEREPTVVPRTELVVRSEPDFSSPPRRKETPFINRLLQHLDKQSPPQNGAGASAQHVEVPPPRPISEMPRASPKAPAPPDTRPSARSLSTSVLAPGKKSESSKSTGRLTPKFNIPETVHEEPAPSETSEDPPWKVRARQLC